MSEKTEFWLKRLGDGVEVWRDDPYNENGYVGMAPRDEYDEIIFGELMPEYGEKCKIIRTITPDGKVIFERAK